jgi:YD repeat-containing protein
VAGQTIEAESSQVRYDRGTGNATFDDQNVIAGRQAMYWAGALRVWVVSHSSWTPQEEYGYDKIGNVDWWEDANAGKLLNYDYPTSGPNSTRPHAVTTVDFPAPDTDWTYGYDANGNMTNRTVASGDYSGDYDLTYDAENRLKEVVIGQIV